MLKWNSRNVNAADRELLRCAASMGKTGNKFALPSIAERRNQMQGIIEEHQRRQSVLQEREKRMGAVVDSERVKQETVVFEADRYPLAAEQQRGENEAEPESSDRATKKRKRSSSLQEGPENTPLVIRQRSPQRQSARDMMRDKSLGRGKSRWDQGPSV